MKQNNFTGKTTELSQQVGEINRNNMKFSKGKCTVLHLEGHNPKHWYMMGAQHTARSLVEKDPGGLEENELNKSQNCALVAKKAIDTLGCIGRTVACRLREVILLCSSALMRPLMVYCALFCAPHYMNLLEHLAKGYTKMKKGLEHLSQEERQIDFRLLSVETRSLRGDLIKAF